MGAAFRTTRSFRKLKAEDKGAGEGNSLKYQEVKLRSDRGKCSGTLIYRSVWGSNPAYTLWEVLILFYPTSTEGGEKRKGEMGARKGLKNFNVGRIRLGRKKYWGRKMRHRVMGKSNANGRRERLYLGRGRFTRRSAAVGRANDLISSVILRGRNSRQKKKKKHRFVRKNAPNTLQTDQEG